MKRLEDAIGQIAQSILRRPQGSLPSNTEENPRGQVKAIHLKEVKLVTKKKERSMEEEEATKEDEEEESNVTNSSQEESEGYRSDIWEEREQATEFDEASNSSDSWQGEGNDNATSQEEDEESGNSELWSDEQSQTSLQSDEDSNGDSEGSEILQDEEKENTPSKDKLGIDMKAAPHAIEKEANGVACKEEEEEEEDGPHTSRWTMETLPLKLGDPGSFSIPCEFYNLFKCHGLIDLGASVNVLPFSIYEQLDLGALKKTNIRIELADSTVRTPRGIVENVLMYVKNLLFPVDFIVLDMEAHPTIPIILGRPFLATSDAVIKVKARKLKLRMGNERVTLKMPRKVTRRNLIAGISQVTNEEDSWSFKGKEKEQNAEDKKEKGDVSRSISRFDHVRRRLDFEPREQSRRPRKSLPRQEKEETANPHDKDGGKKGKFRSDF